VGKKSKATIPYNSVNVQVENDFSAYIKFGFAKESIHVHPTGRINFKFYSSGQEYSNTHYIHDPYIFDGAQLIAAIKLPKALISDSIQSYLVFISRMGTFTSQAPAKYFPIDTLYEIFFVPVEVRDLTQFGYYKFATGVLLAPQLSRARQEKDQIERYVESHRLSRINHTLNHPEFLRLPKPDQDQHLHDLQKGPVFIPRTNQIFEVIFPAGMRARPRLGAMGVKKVIWVDECDLGKDPYLGVRAKFKLKYQKGGHILPDFTDVRMFDFDSELY